MSAGVNTDCAIDRAALFLLLFCCFFLVASLYRRRCVSRFFFVPIHPQRRTLRSGVVRGSSTPRRSRRIAEAFTSTLPTGSGPRRWRRWRRYTGSFSGLKKRIKTKQKTRFPLCLCLSAAISFISFHSMVSLLWWFIYSTSRELLNRLFGPYFFFQTLREFFISPPRTFFLSCE